ncbi:amidohydrolase family protein [Rubrobacter indicoceani]|uniref:amidohydrolase family protein n=1 Tax=Rubrobacter indicoceani TaxID=2051957 RepID=UPI000E5BA85F|nr:amidohydrolase family protein [Rubrobacter indicoceani]
MIGDIRLVDAHVHAVRIPTIKQAWKDWADRYGTPGLYSLYDSTGTLVPQLFDEYFEREGVETAILFCEYSPRSTGIQPVEDLIPLLDHNPTRFRLMANLSPHLHFPLVDELKRQMHLGAVGLKLHPVHGSFPPNDRSLYPVYSLCEAEGFPVVFHCGTSIFPGSTNRYANPELMEDVARDFPDLNIVLAHGGRGWWFDAAAFITLMRPNVYIEVSGLPPQKLPDYYKNYSFERLAKKMIFGTDWPGVPGPQHNARVIADLGLDRETQELVFNRNARKVYRLDGPGTP